MKQIHDFLEVCLHSLIFEFKIYPKELFERTTKYNVQVWLCISPVVIKYIKEMLQTIDSGVQMFFCLIGTQRIVFEFQNAKSEIDYRQMQSVLVRLQTIDFNCGKMEFGIKQRFGSKSKKDWVPYNNETKGSLLPIGNVQINEVEIEIYLINAG